MKYPLIALGEVVDIKGGKRLLKGDTYSTSPTNHPYIRAQNIRLGRVNSDDLVYISDTQHLKIKNYITNEGDVCVTIAGNIGDIGIVPKELDGANLTENAVKLVNPKNCDRMFVMYCLLTYDAQAQMKSFAGGAALPKLGIYKVAQVQIPFPPLLFQRRIAEILFAYDDLIKNNTRRIRILEQMAQAIYQEWFGKVDKETLQKGWEEKALGDIAKDIRRNVHPNDIDPKTPYFGLEHLPRKSIALSEWGEAGNVQSTKLAFKKGEILFGKIRPYFHKVGVAPLDGVASSDTIIIAPKSLEYFGLVLGCVSSEAFVNHATQTSQGTKMPRANWDILKKYPVLIPPQTVLEQYNQIIKDFVEMIQNLLFHNRNLRQTRDLLLPRLVSGEIDVSSLS